MKNTKQLFYSKNLHWKAVKSELLKELPIESLIYLNDSEYILAIKTECIKVYYFDCCADHSYSGDNLLRWERMNKGLQLLDNKIREMNWENHQKFIVTEAHFYGIPLWQLEKIDRTATYLQLTNHPKYLKKKPIDIEFIIKDYADFYKRRDEDNFDLGISEEKRDYEKDNLNNAFEGDASNYWNVD